MYQLRNLIGRTNVSSDPIHKFNESDDFLKLITTSHILVAALQILKMDDLNDIPHVPYMENPQDFLDGDSRQAEASITNYLQRNSGIYWFPIQYHSWTIR